MPGRANRAPSYDFEDDQEGASGGGEEIDLSGVDERGSFAPVAPGTYDGWIDNAEYGTSKAGNKMITWTLKARFEYEDGTQRDRTFFYHTVINQDNLPRLKRLVSRVHPDFDQSKFNPVSSLPDFIGKPCQIKVRIRQYEGSPRNDVQDVLPPSQDGDFMSI